MAPGQDIAAVFDDHVAAEFVDMDLDATMATMTDDPYVNHVPVMTGGVGFEGVRQFYGDHFIGKWPNDIAITPVSRTVGEEPGRRRARPLVHARHRDAPAAAGRRTDGEARAARVLRRRRVRGRQGRARAHLLGPGLAPRCRSDFSTRPSSRSPAPSRQRTCSIREHSR